MVKQTSYNSVGARGQEMVVIDKQREFFPEVDGSGFLNRAASWLVGSESVQAGGLWLSHCPFFVCWCA